MRAALLAALVALALAVTVGSANAEEQQNDHWAHAPGQAAVIPVYFDWRIDQRYIAVAREVMDAYAATRAVVFKIDPRQTFADCYAWDKPKYLCILTEPEPDIGAMGHWEHTGPDGSKPITTQAVVYVNQNWNNFTWMFGPCGCVDLSGPYSPAKMILCHEIGEAIGLTDLSDLPGGAPAEYEPTCLTREWTKLTDTPSADDLAELRAIYGVAG